MLELGGYGKEQKIGRIGNGERTFRQFLAAPRKWTSRLVSHTQRCVSK